MYVHAYFLQINYMWIVAMVLLEPGHRYNNAYHVTLYQQEFFKRFNFFVGVSEQCHCHYICLQRYCRDGANLDPSKVFNHNNYTCTEVQLYDKPFPCICIIYIILYSWKFSMGEYLFTKCVFLQYQLSWVEPSFCPLRCFGCTMH